jgi:hypothetical protein
MSAIATIKGLTFTSSTKKAMRKMLVKLTLAVEIEVQAALVIRGFDYSRSQKPRITRENSYFEPK